MRLSRTRRLMLICILGGLTLAGCGGNPATTQPTVTSTGAPTTTTSPSSSGLPDASTPPTTAPQQETDGEWITVRPTFESRGETEGEPILAEVRSLHTVSGNHWALGTIQGRAAIWKSHDLSAFQIAYLDENRSPRRFIRLNSLVEFDGTLVAGGSGRVPGANDDLERSFILVSTDGGDSWTEIDQPFLSAPFQRLDQLILVGDRLLANVVNDECCGRPVWGGFTTTDLDTWDPIVLPESDAATWPGFVEDGQGTVWAFHSSGLDAGGTRLRTWSTTDGVAWDLIERDIRTGYGYMAVNGVLHATPAGQPGTDFGTVGEQPTGIWRLEGSTWVTLEPDNGQWGDGWVRVWPGIHDADSGRFYGIVARVLRASAHYCYDNVATCSQAENALVTSVDGLVWRDIVRPPDSAEFWRDGHLLWTLWGSPALATLEEGSGRLGHWVVHYWNTDEPPPMVDPPSYPPPEVPVPFFDREVGLPVGSEVRYAWGLGGCGGVYVDDTEWLPTVDPDMSDWPIREVQIDDGPSRYAYGRLRRVAVDELEFLIEGSNETVTLTPRADEREYFCG